MADTLGDQVISDINIADLTSPTSYTVSNGEITAYGTGVFDKLMESVSIHLTDQYTKSRITGADYATVYLGAIQSVIAQAVQFILEEQVAAAKARLVNRQEKGFDDDAKQKILKQALDTWAVLESVTPGNTVPGIVTDAEINTLYTSIKTALSV